MASAKLERLMNLVAALLHTRTPLPADVLRERVGGYATDPVAAHRQFERDKKDLRLMGVPISVEAIPGTDPATDGYRIDPDAYYLPDPGLDPDELAALHLATRLVSVGSDDAGRGLFKLGGRTGRVEADVVPRASIPVLPGLGVLFDALHRDRLVSFTYRGTVRHFVPRALGFRKGYWYVTGWDLDVDDDRVYRLDRIEGTVTDEGNVSKVPAGIAANAEAKLSTLDAWRIGEGASIVATILVDPVAVPTVIAELGEEQVVGETSDGRVEVSLEVSNVDGFRAWILDLGPTVEVSAPAELTEQVVAWLDRAIGGTS